MPPGNRKPRNRKPPGNRKHPCLVSHKACYLQERQTWACHASLTLSYVLKALQKAKICKCVPRAYHIAPLVPVMDWTLRILSMTRVPSCPRVNPTWTKRLPYAQCPWQIRKIERRNYIACLDIILSAVCVSGIVTCKFANLRIRLHLALEVSWIQMTRDIANRALHWFSSP